MIPSASLLPQLRSPRSSGHALIVGDPSFASLAQLPGTRTEALHVAQHQGVEAMIGNSATKEAVLRQLSDARLVHLASYSLVSSIAPTATAVALAEEDRLDMADLAGTDLFAADLVVLSGCDTGHGDMSDGGEVIGLGRQLLAAGAASAIISLWPVEDTVTCVLMNEFHRALASGYDTATALAQAQAVVRVLSPTERRDRYADLARAVGISSDDAKRLRSVGRAAPHEDRHAMLRDASDWAGFVLVGRP